MRISVYFRAAILLSACLALTACGASRKGYRVKSLDPYAWMLGVWQIEGGDEFESWKRVSEKLYEGEAYVFDRHKKTKSVEERIRLELTRKKKVTYTPSLEENGQTMITTFTQVNMSTDTLIFENMAHDFPKRIVYIRLTNSSAKAYIEGKDPGSDRTSFSLRKILNQ